MPPALTYALGALLAGALITSFLVDVIRLPPRLAFLRRYSTVIALVSLLGGYGLLRPGRGTDGSAALSAGRAENRPVFVDIYSNT